MSHDSEDIDGSDPVAIPDATAEDESGGSTRRKVMATGAATWATASIAGCTGDGGDTTTESPGDTPTDTTTTTSTDTPTSTPEPAPENYVVTDDMITGSENIPESAGFVSACSPTRKFLPGMHAIWYVGIYDPETGDQLTDEDLDKVVANVDGGPSVELGWAGDDEENPAQEWNGSWTIPEDTEPQTFSYTIEVTDGDANFRHVGILESSFDVIEYSSPKNYVVTNHTYAISSPESSNGFVSACGPERQFTADMKVGFLVGVYDSDTGEIIGNDTLDSVTITFPEAPFDDLELAWAGDDEEHPADEWGGTMAIPEGTSPGTYKYKVQVTDGDADFYDVGIASEQFTIIEPSSSSSS